jgi:hypothetical protein
MEQMNDFESLLKGAAARYENEQLSETDVSEMIDARLVTGKSKLLASIKKEIVIGLFCTGVLFAYIWVAKYFFDDEKFARFLPFYTKVCYAGMVYCIVGVLLLVRLLQISFLQKATSIRDYVTVLYKKTRRTLQVYLWTSTIGATSMVTAFLLAIPRLPLYWPIIITALLGVGFYYLNVWYLHKRFGKRLLELELLIAEFN